MIQNFSVTSASITDRGLSEKRPQNEDAFLEMSQCAIYAVADGVGGAQAGEVASQMAMEILGEAFVNVAASSDAETVMRSALVQANSAINQMSQELPQLAQMATTVVALHLNDGIATIGHAGDSRLYRLDGKGILHRETADHSLVADEVRAGRMTEEQAETHPGKNIINRALGAEPTVDIETKTIMITEDSSFLICSDGVTRHISDAEIASLLRWDATPEAICARIKEICYERGAQDNLTAVVVRMSEVGKSLAANASVESRTKSEEQTLASARPPRSVNLVEDDDPDDILDIGANGSESFRHAVGDDDILFGEETPDAAIAPRPEVNMDHVEGPEMPAIAPAAVGDFTELSQPDASTESTEEVPSHMDTTRSPESALPHANSVPEIRDRMVDSFDTDIERPFADADERPPSFFASKVFSTAALLLLGSLIGLAAYHFFLADRTVPIQTPSTEMKVANQPQTAFEENRRTLDKNPEAALPRYEAEPKDAENMFLIGRAYLLLGRYPEARKAFQESRELVVAGQVDPDNARTILTEIAIAMAVTNDTLVQNSLKKELEDVKSRSSNAATNSPAR